MDRLEAMSVLVRAADKGSLSAAARTLHMPLPTVSRKVAELEAHLKTVLVVSWPVGARYSPDAACSAWAMSSRMVLEAATKACPASVSWQTGPGACGGVSHRLRQASCAAGDHGFSRRLSQCRCAAGAK